MARSPQSGLIPAHLALVCDGDMSHTIGAARGHPLHQEDEKHDPLRQPT
jgi:hypothetical protein